MKILVICSSVYDDSFYLKNRRVTGLSVMIRDIFDGVSKKEDVYVWQTAQTGCEIKIDKLHILDNHKIHLLKYCNVSNILKFLINCIAKSISVSKSLFIQELYARKFLSILEYLHPDIINFHDLNNLNVSLINVCENLGYNILVTDHLYIGKDDGYSGYEALKKNENLVFSKNNVYTSFICTGMRDRMLNDYPSFDPLKAFVISDGSRHVKPTISIKENNSEIKTILCIGSYNERKNQDQLVRAINGMDEKWKSKIQILFFGKDDKGELARKICESNTSALKYLGTISPLELSKYYERAFATISVSLNEGFGLTIIEGNAYGLPSIFFSDIDSFSDLYSPNSCVPIYGHEDSDIIDAINLCLDRKWDRKLIQAEAQKYNMENVSNEYLNLFRKLSNNSISK